MKAAPFGFSAFVVGVFSVLFWALNYVGKRQKVELRIEEAEKLFEIRKRFVDESFLAFPEGRIAELTVLKAHLLFSINEVPTEVEAPGSGVSFDYKEAVSALLKRT